MRRAVTSLPRPRLCRGSPRLSAVASYSTDVKKTQVKDNKTSTKEVQASAKPLKDDELLEAFGLGKKKNPAAAFRDLKLESRVAALFKETMQLAQTGATNLHPDDLKAQDSAKEVRERLAQRLHELDEKHQGAYEAILSFLIETKVEPTMEREKKNVTEGAIPGTLNAPWKDGSILWQQFANTILGKGYDQNVDEQLDIEGIPPKASSYKNRQLEKFPWLQENTGETAQLADLNDEDELEELDDPTRIDQTKSALKRHTCLLCGPDRHLYPLEPMNVPLLVNYMNASGFIKPRRQTGLCQKMHSRVERTIKQARTMGLFSYKKGTWRVINPVNDTPVVPLNELGSVEGTEDEDQAGGEVNDRRRVARDIARTEFTEAKA